MVNKPLIRPYFLGGVALGGVARIPLISGKSRLVKYYILARYVLLSGMVIHPLFHVKFRGAPPPNATFTPPRNSRPYDQGLLTIGFP